MWCWRRLVGAIEWKIRMSYIQSRRKGTSLIQRKQKRLTGMVTSCVRTAFQHTLLKTKIRGRKDEEENASSYWMPRRKSGHTGI
jgi:hypothetical protein